MQAIPVSERAGGAALALRAVTWLAKVSVYTWLAPYVVVAVALASLCAIGQVGLGDMRELVIGAAVADPASWPAAVPALQMLATTVRAMTLLLLLTYSPAAVWLSDRMVEASDRVTMRVAAWLEALPIAGQWKARSPWLGKLVLLVVMAGAMVAILLAASLRIGTGTITIKDAPRAPVQAHAGAALVLEDQRSVTGAARVERRGKAEYVVRFEQESGGQP